MKRGAWAACTLIILSACGAPPIGLTIEHRRAMIDSVQHTLDDWRDAVNRKDASLVASFYSSDPDFRWYEDGQLRYRSARELGDTLKGMVGVVRNIGLTLIEPDITPLAPGVAEVTSAFVEKLTDSSGQVTGFAGAVTMTVVHGDSGWRFLIGHTSSVPPPDSVARRGPSGAGHRG